MKKNVTKLAALGLMMGFSLSACSSDNNEGKSSPQSKNSDCGCQSKNDSVIQQENREELTEKVAEQPESKVEQGQ